jgi:hypothetical protein
VFVLRTYPKHARVQADNRKEYMNDGPLLRPRYSARIYLASGVEQSFVLLLLIVCIGEFLSSPAVSLADGCTLSYLTVCAATS